MRNKSLSCNDKSNQLEKLEIDVFLKRKIFTFSALSRVTGINQRQLQCYSSGVKKPRKKQICRIEAGIKLIASELSSITLK